ncbi:MAG: fructose-bisphosphatase class II [Candidatus Dormibacteraeota bacterium]|nr:fructose-bisphosphatase class II [Candidatus Dormibacteraeota bacterium]
MNRPVREAGVTFTPGLIAATEAAALACARGLGRGDADRVREAAATAMLEALQDLGVAGSVALGPREDRVLARGSVVGLGRPACCDLAAYPVEGANVVARGLPGAISFVLAVEQGTFPQLPDVSYMDKIIAGPEARGAIDLDDPLGDNLRRLAFARNVRVSDLTVAVLDRPRHQELMQEIRSIGARLLVLDEGELAGSLLAASGSGGVDAMAGVGGLQETIMEACAARCMGAELRARLWPRNDEERELAAGQLDKQFGVEDLAPRTIEVAVTGVTGGLLLQGVWYGAPWSQTESLSLSTSTMTVRRAATRHLNGAAADE